MTAGPAAIRAGGPVLLVAAGATEAAKAELARHGTPKTVVLGGGNAVSDAVVQSLGVPPASPVPPGTSPTDPSGTTPTGTQPTGTSPTGTDPSGTRPSGTTPTTGTDPTGSGSASTLR